MREPSPFAGAAAALALAAAAAPPAAGARESIEVLEPVVVRAPGVELLLDAFNLLDRRANDIEYWYRSRLPGEPAAGFEDRHLHPAEPRTVRVSLRLGF